MAAPTITTARTPEGDLSHAGINEPSMEDILASIRRIIAEDQSSSLARSGIGGLTRRITTPQNEEQVAPQAEAIPQAEPVQAEAESQAAIEAEAPHQTYEAAEEDATPSTFSQEPSSEEPEAFHHAEPAYLPESVEHIAHQPMASHEPAPQAFDNEPLVSPAIGASITSSFQTLAESVMLQDPDLIERVMRDQMRPLLKAWLDDHLPSIVERLVRAEIERVARGGRARNT